MPGNFKYIKLLAHSLHILTSWNIGGVDITSTGTEINQLHNSGAVTADLTKLHAVTALASELNVFSGAANGAPGFVIGAEAANVINVAIQLNKADGNPAAMRQVMLAYLSDDANGDSIVAAAPDGGWAIGTDGLQIPIVAGKCAYLVSEADGDIDVNITHAGGAKTCYLIMVHPSGKISSSGAITFAA